MFNKKRTFVKKFTVAPYAKWAHMFSKIYPSNVVNVRTKSLIYFHYFDSSSPKESIPETRKMFFISPQKFFSFSNLRIHLVLNITPTTKLERRNKKTDWFINKKQDYHN